MTDTEAPTWRNAQAGAAEAAREWVRDEYAGDEDAVHDAAWEYADGTADVIYMYRARAIWVDSSEVQAQEDEADGILSGSDDSADIDRRITLCVFLAIRDAFTEAALEAIEERADAESVA